MSLALARASANTAEFAAYSIPTGVIMMSTGVIGAYTYEPLILAAADQRPKFVRACLRLSAFYSSIFGIILATVLYVISGLSLTSVLVFGLACVVINVAETLRGLFVLSDQSRGLLTLDLSWTGIALILIGSLTLRSGEPVFIVGSWLAGAIVGLSIASSVEHRRGNVTSHGFRSGELDEYKVLSRAAGHKFGAEYMLAAGLGQLLPVMVATISGASAAGSLRLVLVAFGPVTTLQTAVQRVSYAIFRDRLQAHQPVLKLALGAATLLVLTAAFWGFSLFIVGPDRGAVVFGPAWLSTYRLTPLATIYQGFVLAAAPAVALTRARLLFGEAVRRRALTAVITIVSVPIGAAAGGAVGALAAMLFVNALAAGLFWQLAMTKYSGPAIDCKRRGLSARNVEA